MTATLRIVASSSHQSDNLVFTSRLLKAQARVLRLIAKRARLKQTVAHLAAEIEQLTGASHCCIALPARGKTSSTSRRGHSAMDDGDPYVSGAARKSHLWRSKDGSELASVTLVGRTACGDKDKHVLNEMGPILKIAIDNDRHDELALDAPLRFASIAATIPGVVYQRRVTPGGDIHYTYMSEGAQELFGVSPAEILEDPEALFDHFSPAYRSTFRERLLRASRELTLWDVEAEIITAEGHRKFTHAIARPQKQEDGSVLWNGVILDITRMKQAELKLSAAQGQLQVLETAHLRAALRHRSGWAAKGAAFLRRLFCH